ncbi:hypothetical protein AEQU3_01869 [Aequorivita antarctica]|nr:hypothetical protein AEQU3_01869 [Aequorivita antarctica]
MKTKIFFSAVYIMKIISANAQVATINWQNAIGGNARKGLRFIKKGKYNRV